MGLVRRPATPAPSPPQQIGDSGDDESPAERRPHSLGVGAAPILTPTPGFG